MQNKIKKEKKIHLPFHINTTKCDLTCCRPPFLFPFPPLLFSMLLSYAAWILDVHTVLYKSELFDYWLPGDFPCTSYSELLNSSLAGFINAPILLPLPQFSLLTPPLARPLSRPVIVLSPFSLCHFFLHSVKCSCWSLFADWWFLIGFGHFSFKCLYRTLL